jgi:hypothetical protein
MTAGETSTSPLLSPQVADRPPDTPDTYVLLRRVSRYSHELHRPGRRSGRVFLQSSTWLNRLERLDGGLYCSRLGPAWSGLVWAGRPGATAEANDVAQTTADELLAALERLTRAVNAATAVQTRPTGPTATNKRGTDPSAPAWLQQAERIYLQGLQFDQAAHDLASGRLGSTVRGLTNAYRAYKGAGTAAEASAGDEALAQLAGQGGRAAAAAMEGGGAAEGATVAGGGALAGAGAIAGPIAAAVAATVALVIAFKKFRDHVAGATDELLHTQEQLAETSGSMASVFAERELREMQRDRYKGDSLAGSARYLSRAEQDRKDTEKEFDIFWTRIQNLLEGNFNRVIEIAEKPLALVFKIGNFLYPHLAKLLDLEDDDQGVAAWLERIEGQEKQRLQDAKDRMAQIGKDRQRMAQW